MFVIEDDEPEAETEVVVQAMEKQPPSRASDDNDILDCGSGLPEPLPCQTSVSAAKSGHQHVNRNGAPGSNKRKHPQPAERASGKPERVKRAAGKPRAAEVLRASGSQCMCRHHPCDWLPPWTQKCGNCSRQKAGPESHHANMLC